MKNEQDLVLENDKKNLLVSAFAGCGKTHVMIEYIKNLVCKKGLSVEKILVLTFTKAAAEQLKDRLVDTLEKEASKKSDNNFILQQLDLVSTSNICTIDSFCEKFIKKYANLLEISSNFSILDENESKQILYTATKSALEMAKISQPETYQCIMTAFRDNRKKIETIMMKLKNLLHALPNGDEFLNANLKNCEALFEKAQAFLLNSAKEKISEAVAEIDRLYLDEFSQKIHNFSNAVLSAQDIPTFVSISSKYIIPNAPTKRQVDEETSIIARFATKKIKDAVRKIADLADDFESQKNGNLEKSLIKFYKLTENEEQTLKKAKNVLEFGDLEIYMNQLSKNHNLFDNFEFVFVDEYQDTNKIQEKILKNVAKNCNFVAVGDVKQGIYGFRLASSEIFLSDLKTFDTESDSQVRFLKENHRSDNSVLNFVNDIFSKCMTENLTGVNYKKTAMLKGVSNFVKSGKKPVQIDIIKKEKLAEEKLPSVYSVKDAKIASKDTDDLLFRKVREKISDFLGSEISDKNGKLRKTKFSDIAILFRNRNETFSNLEAFLRESGIPICANTKQNLMESPQLQELLNFLKVLLVFDDDVALLSVLTSPLFGFDIENILSERNKKITLCEEVQKNPFYADFCKKIEKYRVFYQIYGLKNMFFEIFKETNYLSFINLYHPNLANQIYKFLDELEQFDRDLPSAISFFENVDISVGSESSLSDDRVLMTTIHDSKGMEWPIVFLMNCEENLFRDHSFDVEISEEFGLCVKSYDFETGHERKSVKMEACKESSRAKNFAEEIMIFYVALTRAESKLCLFGDQKKSYPTELSDCKCYFDFIFFARPDLKDAAECEEIFETSTEKLETITDVQDGPIGLSQDLTQAEQNESVKEKIQEYLNFTYEFGEELNYQLKQSVTSLTNKNQENQLAKFSDDNFKFSDNFIDAGNAYHLALKILDFEKISTLSDVEKSLSTLESKIENLNLVDKDVLLKNILLLKELTHGGKIYKEKEFIMKLNPNQVFGGNFDEEILTQGIVDLFVIKNDKVILVDYKFSKSKSEILLQKYSSQLKLYKIAIEKSFNLEVEKCFILSLRNAQLIQVD